MKHTCLPLLILAGAAIAAGDESRRDAETTLRDALFTRVSTEGASFGATELDILYFGDTKHLLSEPSHAAALAALDEFANRDEVALPSDPLRRALLLRDLWQLFDWARGEFVSITETATRRDELKRRIASAMRRLRLTSVQLAQLPDNLVELEHDPALAGIAKTIRRENGPWVLLGTSGTEPAAPVHVAEQKGRSVFLVLVRLPKGREATREWLATLQYRRAGQATPMLNTGAQPFPQGTVWALVRVMNVIDAAGHIRPTHLVESVQFRVYTDEPPRERPGFGAASGGFQHLGQWQLNRAQPPHLRVLVEQDRLFSRGIGIDWLERRENRAGLAIGLEPPYRFCQSCHHLMGNRAIRSLEGFEGRATPAFLETTFTAEAAKVIAIKEHRPDWQELSAWMRGE